MKIALLATPTGANIYAPRSAIVYRADVTPHKGGHSDGVDPAFFTALFEQLPALRARIGALPRDWVQDRASLAYLLMLAAVELQNALGCEIKPGEVRPTTSAGIYEVIYGYENLAAGAAAGKLAAALIAHLLPAGETSREDARPTFDFAAARQRFAQSFQHQVMALEHRYVANAARARGIPVDHLGDGLVLFGQGRFQKRRLKHFSDQTSHISFLLSSNKALTNRLLAEIGLPVPKQRVVASRDDAIRAAGDIGYPVVVKPLDSDFGRGVSVGLADPKSVARAYDAARRFRRSVLVEKMLDGTDHRLLVVDGKFVAAANRIPAHVVGDGASTVAALVDQANRDPRRGAKGAAWLRPIELDDEADRLLAKAGHRRDSVPAPRETIHLRGAANLSAGGTSIDVTERVHTDNRQMACLAAKVLGIDVAGIDFITTDIGRSYKESGGAICEVNTTPALSPHVAAEGPPRDIAGPIVAAMYPPGAPSRIPTAVITGRSGGVATARLLARILGATGHVVGLATRDGVFVDGAQTAGNDISAARKAHLLIRHPLVDAAVLEITPGEVLRHGLGFEACDVAAVLDAPAESDTADRRGLDPVSLRDAVAVVARAARHTAVFNADDALCRDLATRLSAEQTLLASTRGDAAGLDGPTPHPRSSTIGTGPDDMAALIILDKTSNRAAGQTDIACGSIQGATAEQRTCVLIAATMAHYLGKSAEEIGHALRAIDLAAL